METITLSSPEVVQITNTGYKPVLITLNKKASTIIVMFEGSNGEQREWIMSGDVAMTRIKALNTANLSTKSLERRIMETAIADGVFAGTISGTPDV